MKEKLNVAVRIVADSSKINLLEYINKEWTRLDIKAFRKFIIRRV
jgi:hypothetical protein